MEDHGFPPWCCPSCGWDTDGEDDDNLVSATEPKENIGASLYGGGHSLEWEETWLCPNCGLKFTISVDG